ncbi:MAG: hypothetical protein U0936_02990 [Planctomycetaceae bacterium]
MPAPISTEFRTVYDEQNLGIPIEQALRNMLVRIPNMDLQFFVTAVAIQRPGRGRPCGDSEQNQLPRSQALKRFWAW